MKRTGRTLVILTVAAWLAALSPVLADTGPAGAPAPDTGPAGPLSPARPPTGDDPVRIGIGVGGEIIDILSHDEDEDEDNGDEDGDEDNGDENGDEDNGDENGDGLLDGLVELLVGNGDGDEGNGDGLVTQVLEVLFGEEDDSVGSGPVVSAKVVPAAASRPADDDGVVGEVLELLEDDELEGVEDVLDLVEDTVDFVLISVGDNQVVATVCQVRHGLHNGLVILGPIAIGTLVLGPIAIPPIGGPTPPVCVP